MKKGDWLIIVLSVLMAALPLFLMLRTEEPPAWVVVRRDGEIIRTLPLDAEETVEFSDANGANWIQVKNGAVRMIRADCSDQICVRRGDIRRTGETLVCLPHRLTVEIVGGASNADAVTQ